MMKHLKPAPAAVGGIALESEDSKGIALEGIALEGITDSLKGFYTKLKQVLFGDPSYHEAIQQVHKLLDTNLDMLKKLKGDLSKSKFDAYDAKVNATYMRQLGFSGSNAREIVQSIKGRQAIFDRAVKLAYDTATKADGKDPKSQEVRDANAAFKAMVASVKGGGGEVPAQLKLTREDTLNIIQALIDLLTGQKNTLRKYDFAKFQNKVAMESWRGVLSGSDDDIIEFLIAVCKFVFLVFFWFCLIVNPIVTILMLLFWIAIFKIVSWAFDVVFGTDI